MGAWGHGSFENDSALDWVQDFLQGADVEDALGVQGRDGYLDVDDGSAAVAAAEVVAAINGHPSKDLPSEVRDHLQAHKKKPSTRLTTLALSALERVLQNDSELKQLWSEGGDRAWGAAIRALRKRLSAQPKAVRPAPKPTHRVRRSVPDIRTVLELRSPTGAYELGVVEIDSPAGANTQGALEFRKAGGGSGLFMVMGTKLGIMAQWVDNDRLEISIPAGLAVEWGAGPRGRVQHFDQVVNVVYRRVKRSRSLSE